jgi:hypothetical protein
MIFERVLSHVLVCLDDVMAFATKSDNVPLLIRAPLGLRYDVVRLDLFC